MTAIPENTPRLSEKTLKRLKSGVNVPKFDRCNIAVGQVHLGVGAFFKAHLAPYTQHAIQNTGENWGVCGVSLQSPTARNALAPQDCLFTVTEKDGDGASVDVVSILKDMLVAPENPQAVVNAIAEPAVKIVTLTVTEKGYCLDPATNALQHGHPDILHDLKNAPGPRTSIGILAAAIKKRIEARESLTILSCDNLSENGARLQAAAKEFIAEAYPDILPAIDDLVRFPSTMVDRITPAATDEDRREVSGLTGLYDEAAVVTEPFTQWVIEDAFSTERPDWESAGALIVSDVAPYELVKLRLLNGAHSTIAYLGYLMGYEFVSDAMADPDFSLFILDMQNKEIAPTLSAPPDLPLAPYIEELNERFRNPALRHRTWQIAMDGSQKLPQRLVQTIRAQLNQHGPIERLSLAIAAWTQYVSGTDESGAAIDVRDPMAERLIKIGREAGNDPDDRARAFLSITEIFGPDLILSERFYSALSDAIGVLQEFGARRAISMNGGR